MGRARAFNDIANERFQKESPMTLSMTMKGVIREVPLDESYVDERADDIIARLDAKNIRPLICDIARFLADGFIEQSIARSCQPGIRCRAARFNSLCYKQLLKSPLYQAAKAKRQRYRHVNHN